MNYVKLIVFGVIVIAVLGCLYGIYSWGVTSCKVQIIEKTEQTKANNEKNKKEITQRVLGTSDDSNLEFLLQNYLRAN